MDKWVGQKLYAANLSMQGHKKALSKKIGNHHFPTMIPKKAKLHHVMQFQQKTAFEKNLRKPGNVDNQYFLNFRQCF